LSLQLQLEISKSPEKQQFLSAKQVTLYEPGQTQTKKKAMITGDYYHNRRSE